LLIQTASGRQAEARVAYTAAMETLVVCTFAVGLPNGPRSSSFGVTLAKDRTEMRLSARTQVSSWEMAVHPPPDIAGPDAGNAPPTRAEVRKAVFEGAWLGESGFSVAWPGRQIGPGTRRQLSLYVSGSALRKFEQPAGEPEPHWVAPPKGLGQVVVSFLVAAGDGRPDAAEGADEQLLGHGALADGRTVWVSARREEFISPLQKAGLFTALRKRPPPGISQAAAWRDGTRVLFACELDGAGLVVEQPGDLFRRRANY
jgi:hypothetical protein